MADFNSSLPVRTQNNGDVVAFLADHTTPSILNSIKTSSTAAVAADNSLVVALSPNTPLPAGSAIIGSVNQGTSPWITKDQADGPVSPGTVASFSQLAGGQFNTVLPTLTNTQQAALQLDASGRLITTATITSLGYDTNYGTVGANTLRGAAQIGNATGAADFNFGTIGAQSLRAAAQIGNATGSADFAAGNSSAQTLRVVIASNQVAIPISNFPATVDTNYGTVGASTLRSAAQIGNATGAADFNAGATGAQTLRTVANQGAPNTAANAWPTVLTTGGVVNSPTNPIFVSNSDTVGTSIDNYQTTASVVAAASTNQDYTVTAAKTFYSKQVWASASGKIKVVVQFETAAGSGTFNTFWVGFNSTADTNILIPIPTSKTQVAGARIRITITNLDLLAQDVYSTLSGTEQ